MKMIHAIFEHGVLRPEELLVPPEGSRAELQLSEGAPVTDGSTRFAHLIGCIPADELDQMERDIEEAFGRVDPDAWK